VILRRELDYAVSDQCARVFIAHRYAGLFLISLSLSPSFAHHSMRASTHPLTHARTHPPTHARMHAQKNHKRTHRHIWITGANRCNTLQHTASHCITGTWMTGGYTQHESRRHRDEDMILRRDLFREHSPGAGVHVRIVPMICTVHAYRGPTVTLAPPPPPPSSDSHASGPFNTEEHAQGDSGRAGAGNSGSGGGGGGGEGGGKRDARILRGGWTAMRYWLLQALPSHACSRSRASNL